MRIHLSRLILIVIAVVYAGLGVAFLFFTKNMISVLPMRATPAGDLAAGELTQIAAVYGGQGLALAAIFAWGAVVSSRRRMALSVAAIVLAGLVVGRVIGMLMYPPVGVYSIGIAVIEAIGCGFCVFGLMKLGTEMPSAIRR